MGAELHDRHHHAERAVRADPQPNAGDPAVVGVAAVDREDAAEPDQLKAVLRPYPAEGMTCWLVSARVGNVRTDPSLIEPISA